MHPLLLLSTLLFPQEIGDHDWKLFHVPEDGAFGLYVDVRSIHAQGEARTAWVKNDRLSADEDGIIRRVHRTRYDCHGRTATRLVHYEYGASGALSDYFEVPAEQQRAEPVVAGSADGAALAHLCG